jgi:hypothetical protein
MTARRPVPRRHWRNGDAPLPTGAEALDEPFSAFPSWFMRITCDRCGKDRMLNEAHTAHRDLPIREILKRMRHDSCGGRREGRNADRYRGRQQPAGAQDHPDPGLIQDMLASEKEPRHTVRWWWRGHGAVTFRIAQCAGLHCPVLVWRGQLRNKLSRRLSSWAAAPFRGDDCRHLGCAVGNCRTDSVLQSVRSRVSCRPAPPDR